MKHSISLVCIFTLFATQAHAHIGHLGELAGHSHWIGLGAMAGAAALAILLGAKSNEETEEETENEPEASGETA